VTTALCPPRLHILLVLPLVAVLLTGCRMTVDARIDLTGDGSGTLEMVLTADAELAQAAQAAGVDPLGRLVTRVEALDGWEAREDDGGGDDGQRVVRLRSGFGSPTQFSDRWTALTDALDAPEGRLLGPLDVAVDEDAGTVAVEGTLAVAPSEVAAADLGTDLVDLTAQLRDALAVSLTVQTPGTPIMTDGTVAYEDQEAAEGPATVTWTVPVGAEVPVTLVADQGGIDWLALALPVGGGLLAVLLVAGGVLAQRRR
jgi:hypothetical protein